jgi:hypothetical protein
LSYIFYFMCLDIFLLVFLDVFLTIYKGDKKKNTL